MNYFSFYTKKKIYPFHYNLLKKYLLELYYNKEVSISSGFLRELIIIILKKENISFKLIFGEKIKKRYLHRYSDSSSHKNLTRWTPGMIFSFIKRGCIDKKDLIDRLNWENSTDLFVLLEEIEQLFNENIDDEERYKIVKDFIKRPYKWCIFDYCWFYKVIKIIKIEDNNLYNLGVLLEKLNLY